MSEVPHVVHNRVQSLLQRLSAGTHGRGLVGRIHTVLLLFEAGLRQPVEVVRGTELCGLESCS